MCDPIQKCSDHNLSVEECPENDIILVTNPECTDSHQGSDPNNIRGCDSNQLATASHGATLFKDPKNESSQDYKKMMSYKYSQNCYFVGDVAKTSGVKGGYNLEAIRMADIRGNDTRGNDSKVTFSGPGKNTSENDDINYGTTAPNAEDGYKNESAHYNGTAKIEGNFLRKPDLKKIADFNTNRNNVRTEVVKAATIRDPECFELESRYACEKSCSGLKHKECTQLTSQCAWTNALACSRHIVTKDKCFNSEGSVMDCALSGVARRIITENEEACGNDDSNPCLERCTQWDPLQQDGQPVVAGATSIKRTFTQTCKDATGNTVQCQSAGVYKPNVVREDLVFTDTSETCKNDAGTTVTCKNDKGEYNADVQTIETVTGDPFHNLLSTWDGEGFNTVSVDTTNLTGSCAMLELDQLEQAYKCCSKKEGSNPLVQYYNEKMTSGESSPDAPTALSQSVRLAAPRRVKLQSF